MVSTDFVLRENDPIAIVYFREDISSGMKPKCNVIYKMFVIENLTCGIKWTLSVRSTLLETDDTGIKRAQIDTLIAQNGTQQQKNIKRFVTCFEQKVGPTHIQ
jgi:hypothetical protein